jgi:GNAT superfamily N-acetyltransferase
MHISKAGKSDLAELSKAFDAYRVFYKKQSDVEAAHNFLAERLSLGDAVIIIARNQSGVLVGFTQLYPSFSSTRMQRLWILNDLFVFPEFRGLGYSKLMPAASSLKLPKTTISATGYIHQQVFISKTMFIFIFGKTKTHDKITTRQSSRIF